MIKYFLTGFSVKAMTGVDDMMTHVPVIYSYKKETNTFYKHYLKNL
jgi:hypothetical protein